MAAIACPPQPDSGPKYFKISTGGARYNAIPIKIRMFRKGTAMFWNIFHPFFSPIIVFFRSSKKESSVSSRETIMKAYALWTMRTSD